MANHGVGRVIAAEGVSNFGSMLSRLAIPWVAALTLNASAGQMAWLLVADVLAAFAGSVFLGAWVDARGKRAVMLVADTGRAVLVGLLAFLVWRGSASFELLLWVAAANGVLGMAFDLARSAWLAQRVDHPALPNTNAKLSTVGSLSETAAFALGGWIFQGLGAAWSLALDALSYIASALCLGGVDEAKPARAATSLAKPVGLRGTLLSMRRNMALVTGHPRLRALATIEALGSLSFALTGTVYTLFVTRELGLPTGQLGMIAAMGGLGAVLGAMLAPRWGRSMGAGRCMTLGLAAFALGAACIPMAHGAGWVAVGWLVAHQIVGDAGHALHDVHDRTLRQTLVQPAELARADAGIRSLGQLALLAGAALGGGLGTHWGNRPVLWLGATCALLAACVAALGLRDIKHQASLS